MGNYAREHKFVKSKKKCAVHKFENRCSKYFSIFVTPEATARALRSCTVGQPPKRQQ